jgi:archaellin
MKKKLIILLIIISIIIYAKGFFEPKPQVEDPKFNYENSKLSEEVNIKLNTETKGAKIHYTTDPNEELNVLCDTFEEGDSILVEYDQEITIRAFAIKKGMEDSNVVKKTYTVKRKVQKPEIRINKINNNYTVTFGRDYSSDIYYTLNGEQPTRESNLYEGRIQLDGSSVVKAFAVREGYWDSETVEQDISMQLEKPKITSRKITDSEKQIEIISPNKDDKLYYTLDGEQPTRESNLYEDKFIVDKWSNIQAIAVKEGYVNSDIAEKEVEVKLKRPKIEVKDFGNNKKIILTSPNEDDKIYYTIDGSLPNEKSNIFDDEIILRNSATIQAKAVKEGYKDSDISATNIRVNQVFNEEKKEEEERIKSININLSRNSNIEGINIIKVENENNLILSQEKNKFYNENNIKLSKISKEGKIIFDKKIKFNEKIIPHSITFNNKNYSLLTSKDNHLNIIKFNQKGEKIKERTIFENHLGVKIIPYKNNYIIGSISNPDSDNPHISISKISNDLKYIIWQKRLEFDENKSIENLYDIEIDSKNNIIVIGDTNKRGKVDIYFSILNQKGEIINNKIIEGNKIDSGYLIKEVKNNNYLIAAESNSKFSQSKNNQKKTNAVLTLVNKKGKILDRKIFGDSNSNYPVNLKKYNKDIILTTDTIKGNNILSTIYWLNINNNKINLKSNDQLPNDNYQIKDINCHKDMLKLLIVKLNRNEHETRVINIIN